MRGRYRTVTEPLPSADWFFRVDSGTRSPHPDRRHRSMIQLSSLRADQITHNAIQDGGRSHNAQHQRDVFRERVVPDLHGIHLGPGNALAAAITVQGLLVWEARNRVWGDDDVMPFHDLAAAPYPYRFVRLE